MRKLMACLVALVATATASNAAIITYGSLAAFNAATHGQSTVNFDGIAPSGGFTYFGNSLTTGGVTFTTPNPNLFVIDQGFSSPTWNWNSGGVLQSNSGGDITATYGSGKNAVGFDVNGTS